MNTLPEIWFPDHQEGEINPLAQALLYPYPAPVGDFFMCDGLPQEVPEGISPKALEGRTPVLSVGSNRAPLQLRRKFGKKASLPVTACILRDADIVFAASLSFYSAVPATACPCPGVLVQLNIAWLDEDQLARMHDTEAVGIAYDYIRFDDGVVDHGTRLKSAVFDQPVYGYQSRAGVLKRDDNPVAHRGIPAKGRHFAEANEAEILAWVKELTGSEHVPIEEWIIQMHGSRAARQSVGVTLAKHGFTPSDQPWQVADAEAKNSTVFL